jgi:GNAT superfamily N-acetyltransferase
MGEGSFSIRLAEQSDVDELYSFDLIAHQSEHRRAFIQRSVIAQNCYLACGMRIVGYAVLEYTFYEMGFVSMLYIHSDWRRHGVGTQLLGHLETLCKTDKLFTSTNLSNVPMQGLLARMRYILSGVIHGLDEGDPELIYLKRLP